MTPALAGLGAMAAAWVGIVVICARFGRGPRWRQAHLPLIVAIVCGLSAAGHDRLSVALLSRNVAPARVASEFLWLVLGLPVAAMSISAGVGMIRGLKPSLAGVWGAAAAGSLACGLALAGRLALLDGQLMVLAGLALAWWRGSAPNHTDTESTGSTLSIAVAYALAIVCGVGAMSAAGQPYGLLIVVLVALVSITALLAMASGAGDETAQVGDESWSAMSTMLLGLGIVVVTRIGVMGYVDVRNAAATWEEKILVIAELVRSAPYLGGLVAQAPEALWLLVLAGILAAGGRNPGRRAGVGTTCIAAGVAIAVWRVGGLFALGG